MGCGACARTGGNANNVQSALPPSRRWALTASDSRSSDCASGGLRPTRTGIAGHATAMPVSQTHPDIGSATQSVPVGADACNGDRDLGSEGLEQQPGRCASRRVADAMFRSCSRRYNATHRSPVVGTVPDLRQTNANPHAPRLRTRAAGGRDRFRCLGVGLGCVGNL